MRFSRLLASHAEFFAARINSACPAARTVLLLLLLPASVHAQDYGYTINNGSVTITGYMGAGGSVVIPDTIQGIPVTAIGAHAFVYQFAVTSITIPSSVTTIGDTAFGYCSSMESVIIPEGVSTIEKSAFYNCAGLKSVTIPDSVTTVGDSAFWYCTSLTSATIGKNVAALFGSAFSGCTSLTNIEVNTANPNYSALDGIVFNKTQTALIIFPGGKVGPYTIPNGVTTIGDSAFNGCANLANVVFGDSVTNIASGAFHGCSSLTNIVIPDTVTSVGDAAFIGCTGLASVHIPNGITAIGNYVFSYCGSLTSVTIPRSVITIGSYAFNECSSLASLTIPENVTAVLGGAFQSCTNLASLYFSGNAPYYGYAAFDGAASATIYYLPGTSGWGSTFAGRPTVLWNPTPQITAPADPFSFTITGSSNLVVVVEAATSLTSPDWTPVSTNTLTDGSSTSSDPQSSNHPTRFYRLRSP